MKGENLAFIVVNGDRFISSTFDAHGLINQSIILFEYSVFNQRSKLILIEINLIMQERCQCYIIGRWSFRCWIFWREIVGAEARTPTQHFEVESYLLLDLQTTTHTSNPNNNDKVSIRKWLVISNTHISNNGIPNQVRLSIIRAQADRSSAHLEKKK